ncbi:hypothetical protein CR513_08081, partial [Mucuna pruriens]
MKHMFMEKFFLASRTATIRKEICGIRQHFGETLHEYWERFNKLCATCLHHQISEQLLIWYFYKGLTMTDRSMIDASSGGALMDKTPGATRNLISNMESNTQQFRIRGADQPRMVSKIGAVDNLRLKNQLTELTSLVRKLAIGQHQPSIVARVCGICTSIEHPIDMCPTLQETESNHPESVGSIGGYQYRKHPYQTISAGAKSRAICSSAIWTCPECTLRSSRLSTVESAISSTTFPTTVVIESASSRQLAISKRLDEVASNKQSGVPTNNMQFQQNMKATIQDLKIQIGQLANTVSHLHSVEYNNIPSQTIPNARGNVSVVTLRSGRELPQPAPQQELRPTDADSESDANSQVPQQDRSIPLSFLTQTLLAKKPESDEELLKMFQKIPKYAKFLKELCVHKRKKMKGEVESGAIVSALTQNNEFTTGVQQALPKKFQDPGIFFVSCTIGNCTFVDAMLDLGASINVMPTSICKSLKFGDLEPTRMTIQLANRSVVQLLGVLKEALVQVNELIFLTDFYVLDMEDETSRKGSTLILGDRS